MNSNSSLNAGTDAIDELVDRWESLRGAGQDMSLSEICKDCPELREEVARRIAALESIDARLRESETGSFASHQVATPGGKDGVPANTPPKKLGRYQLVELVGQGGFGQVWRARDPQLQRDVALKIPRPERLRSTLQGNGFLEEARKVARLDHPGIVPVFDYGREASYYFIVSRWIDGSSLAKRISTERLPPAEAARIVAEVAEALHYAHLRDLVHRDIKPGNILLDVVDKAYLTDFGIAASEDELLAELDGSTGTPAYMAPEQAAGQNLRVTPRTDIYSLGVVFYELLTGRAPFCKGSLSELRRQVLEAEPRPPRTIDDTIPAGLERICLKAMAKEPDHRYATAADMAQDLRHRARPHRRGPVMMLAVVAVLVLVGLPIGILLLIGRVQPDPPLAEPLSGSVNVRVLKAQRPDLGLIDLTSSGALPLRTGDAVRVEVALNRPAYAYLVWIDSEGEVLPIHPWKPGDWERPPTEARVQRVALPEDPDAGWPLKGSSGLETVLLLARDEPLPADFDLRDMFSGLARPVIDQGGFAIWFGEGAASRTVQSVDRGPDFGEVIRHQEALAEMHRRIRERLEPYFRLHEGVSFVKEGTVTAPGTTQSDPLMHNLSTELTPPHSIARKRQ